MTGTTKKKAGALVAFVLGLLLTLLVSGCNPQGGWQLSNLYNDGNVEKLACEQVDSASEQLEDAVTDKDGSALTTIGVWSNGGIVQDDLDKVRERIKVRKQQADYKAGCNVVTTTVSASSSSTISASPEDCPNGTPLSYDPNRDYNVVTDQNGDGIAVANVREDLVAIHRDPKTLAYRANHLGFWENAKDWKPFVSKNGKCLTTKGELIFAKVEGALTAEGTKVDENGQAPAGYYNTGMDASGPVVNSVPGITGDLSAIIYTLADGTKVIVLKRCGNLALPSAPRGYTVVAHIPGSVKPSGTTPGTGGPPPGTTTDNPPPTTLDTKQRGVAPGDGGPGDGGASVHGGQGDSRGQVTGGVTAPTGGQPAPVQPTPQPAPAPAPVPGGTPAPQNTPTLPPATGAAPSTAPGGSTGCAPGDSDC